MCRSVLHCWPASHSRGTLRLYSFSSITAHVSLIRAVSLLKTKNARAPRGRSPGGVRTSSRQHAYIHRIPFSLVTERCMTLAINYTCMHCTAGGCDVCMATRKRGGGGKGLTRERTRRVESTGTGSSGASQLLAEVRLNERHALLVVNRDDVVGEQAPVEFLGLGFIDVLAELGKAGSPVLNG
jgi:hypothetical protein